MSIGMIVAFVVGVGWLFGQILSPIVASQAAEGTNGSSYAVVLSAADSPLLLMILAAAGIGVVRAIVSHQSLGGR